ncbi:MAG: AAA family ATPase [Candidatus Ancillula sp.]|jgi:DNA repair protein RecN (Recombination protein N)|nr:AAA family ATPase [Candidatus Ancillula sp.]
MLHEISIKNVGVFKSATLTLKPGMTAITGETGAGKSMLLSSLALIAGETPERIKSLKETLTGSIEVEAEFEGVLESVKNAVEEVGAHIDDSLIISRGIDSQTKRASAVLGGKKVPSATLQDISEHLVVIHGQQDHLQLSQPKKVRELIDDFANIWPLLQEYQALYTNFKNLERDLASFEERASELKKNYEYNKYVVSQIDGVNIQDGEEEELLKRRERILHSGQVGEILQRILQSIEGVDGSTEGTSSLLSKLENSLQELTAYSDDDFESEINGIEEFYLHLNSISRKVQQQMDSLEYSQADLDYIETRLNDLNTLTNSWGPSLSDVLRVYEDAKASVEAFDQLESIEDLKEKVDHARQLAFEQAQNLHSLRVEASVKFSEGVSNQLVELGFGDASVSLEVSLSDTLNAYGVDTFSLLFSPHSSVPLGPIGKVASGGELSRIMLAVEIVILREKHIGANKKSKARPSGKSPSSAILMVFDEVDAGIGGDIANKVANLLSEIAKDMQIVVVTHLAQIAAKADHQYSIVKVEDKAGMHARIEELNGDARLEEIARMLSGNTSSAAMTHAKELLGLAP